MQYIILMGILLKQVLIKKKGNQIFLKQGLHFQGIGMKIATIKSKK